MLNRYRVRAGAPCAARTLLLGHFSRLRPPPAVSPCFTSRPLTRPCRSTRSQLPLSAVSPPPAPQPPCALRRSSSRRVAPAPAA
eukprot:4969902-Prymnesium_polylepis.1